LHQTLHDADTLVKQLNAASLPLAQGLPGIVRQLQSTARRLNTLAGSMQAGYGGNSQFNQNASRLLVQLTETARAFRSLADLLTRHPEALIRGRTDAVLP
jgi:paraquat-inducible protein B